MKKIGILTFSYGTNFGGTLQCLGLYKTIENMNINVEILNYIPRNTYSFKRIYLSGAKNKNVLNLKKIFLKLKYNKKNINLFNKFRENEMKITKVLTEKTFERVAEKKDILVVGSDQVWNVSGGIRKNYFFQGIKKSKKISYAACSGSDFFHIADKNKLTNALEEFNKISVRNEHTKGFVKRLIDKEVDIVCDPSILYDYKIYLTKNKIKEKYILTYILGNEIIGTHENVLKKIKEKYGDIKIIAIGITFAGSGSLQFYPWADEVLYDASPEEWLNLINNAEFIYTDSYHGVLFSMKFHKPFLAYYAEKARASRFIDLGKRYQVSDYIVANVDEIDDKKSLEKKIDYKKIDNLLEEHRQLSIKFLKNALGEE